MIMRKKEKILAAILLSVLVLVGCLPIAQAAHDPLKPDDLHYLDGEWVQSGGNIILHKQAERTGANEWEVTVQAVIEAASINKQQIEMVVLLDLSGSMNWCSDPSHGAGDHVHSDACCGKTSYYHSHDENCCGHK